MQARSGEVPRPLWLVFVRVVVLSSDGRASRASVNVVFRACRILRALDDDFAVVVVVVAAVFSARRGFFYNPLFIYRQLSRVRRVVPSCPSDRAFTRG